LPSCCCAGCSSCATRWHGACAPASDVLALTYAYDSLHRVAAEGSLGARGTADVAVILGATVLALARGAATLRRRTA
jgi:hypothetical protein